MTYSEDRDYRLPSEDRMMPRAVVDIQRGTIVAIAEVTATPAEVFRALSTKEVERWWRHPDFYYWKDFQADLRVQGKWRVTVCLNDGSTNEGWGEFAEIDEPLRLVTTRNFQTHPLLEKRETTVAYSLYPIGTGTRVDIRDEGFLGRMDAAFGNAEHWERVLGWLQSYYHGGPAA